MWQGLRNSLRRWVRGVQRGKYFPLLLPHHHVSGQEVVSLQQGGRMVGANLAAALQLCDGTRALAHIARQARCARSELIVSNEQGLIILWRSPVPAQAPLIDRKAHTIILSPHLDDAALCCGGRMLGEQNVLVVNIFSRGVWWRFPYTADDAQRIADCRRAEEDVVARLAGVVMIDLDLPEALSRGYSFETTFTAPVARTDAPVIEGLSDRLVTLAQENPLAHWYFPLGLGGHVDHRVVRDTALDALPRAGVKASHLHLYEDQPYAAEGKEGDMAQRHANLKLRREPLDIEDVMHWKLELLRAYWSQFTWSQIAGLRPYAKKAGAGESAEVVWTVTA